MDASVAVNKNVKKNHQEMVFTTENVRTFLLETKYLAKGLF